MATKMAPVRTYPIRHPKRHFGGWPRCPNRRPCRASGTTHPLQASQPADTRLSRTCDSPCARKSQSLVKRKTLSSPSQPTHSAGRSSSSANHPAPANMPPLNRLFRCATARLGSPNPPFALETRGYEDKLRLGARLVLRGAKFDAPHQAERLGGKRDVRTGFLQGRHGGMVMLARFG